MNISQIKILEAESNKRGDLFGRLMGDLFLSLGYENARYNIHKSGREIDIEALHRTETRKIIAECKATKKSIGGDEINKFVGSLDVEKRKSPSIYTTGYYVSLGGFTETAIEQEKDAGNKRVVLLNSKDVVKELIKGKIIVSLEIALEKAGRCVGDDADSFVLDRECELFAHSLGWIWVVYFSQSKIRKGFCLIHADGEVLSSNLASKVIQDDHQTGGCLSNLKYFSHDGTPEYSNSLNVKEGYFKYLLHECGDIKLDGLPADGEIGSRRLNLENIYVPLHVVPSQDYPHFGSEKPEEKIIEDKNERNDYSDSITNHNSKELLGDVLSNTHRLTILAGPGGGKSTLLKRIAVAYAFPERRKIIDDRLPEKDWLPLFIRCRQLDSSVTTTILDILYNIPQRAEINNLSTEFNSLVNYALQNGNALLLIDGLDEIADESLRVSFVHQLRVFLAIYPSVSIVITSRKAGFRIIGSALLSHCSHYELASFDSLDIKRLTLLWHREVIGDKLEIKIEADKLSDSIIESDRLFRLAKNPLLLTTLLLVKRWVGQLPTRRSVLYGKAIEVLLMTWNVEGHDPLDQEEVIPQLSFVAYSMMIDGVQRISLRRLKELLLISRKQMPEILGYAKLSVQQFIERVELRSSLLIQSGHEIEDGTLYPFYEFQHLTFQEYLASKAIIDGYYQNQSDEDTLLDILQPFMDDESWKEVITLSAVLAGRKGHVIVKYLINQLKSDPSHLRRKKTKFRSNISPTELLTQCIQDEVQISPETLEESLEWIARRNNMLEVEPLLNSKFGSVFERVVFQTYLQSNEDLLELGGVLAEVVTLTTRNNKGKMTPEEVIEYLCELTGSTKEEEVIYGLLGIMQLIFKTNENTDISEEPLRKALISSLSHLTSDNNKILIPTCWILAWYFTNKLPLFGLINSNTLERLIDVWRNTDNGSVEYLATWAIREFPLTAISRSSEEKIHDNSFYYAKFNSVELDTETDHYNRPIPEAAVVVSYFYNFPWFKEALIKISSIIIDKEIPFRPLSTLSFLLSEIGADGEPLLALIKDSERNRKAVTFN